MKKKMINATHIEGYVYEHKLEKKVSGEILKILEQSLLTVF